MDIPNKTHLSKKFQENHKAEQYFFTDNFIKTILNAFEYIDKSRILCLCTPSIANEYFEVVNNEELDEDEGKERKFPFLLDFDTRFSYLPNYFYYNLLEKEEVSNELKEILMKIEYIIFDPPFFGIKMSDLRYAVDSITRKDYSKKILFFFSNRDEKNLLLSFQDYKLRLTKVRVEYENVCPTKWENVSLYSNFESGKVKFMKK